MGIISTKGFCYRGVPVDLARSIINESEVNTFIETGTHWGNTAIWAAQFFDKVITIEASQTIFDNNNFNQYKNINALFGSSASVLPEIMADNSIIYLDAHFSGGDTFNDFPLLEELKIINSYSYNNVTIIIDDARYCMALWNDDSYGSLDDIIYLMSKNKARKVVIIDDMIIAVPMNLKHIIDEYTNRISKKYFNQFIEDSAKISRNNSPIKKILEKGYSKIRRLYK